MRPLEAALAAALLCGCRVVDSKAWNLEQLHDETGRHRYSGAIQGDTEYYVRHVVFRSIAFSGARVDEKAPIAIPDPASACLENLIELGGFDGGDPRNAAIQVEWCARLAVSDPSALSRERAVLDLGRAGARLQAGNPAPLPPETTPAGPEAAAEALAGLVRASRPAIERRSDLRATERLDLDSACQLVLDMPLDLEGARRMLHASIELAVTIGLGRSDSAPLARLAEDLERRCVRFAIAAGLKDPEPLVRGAAVEASLHCVGPAVFDPILAQLASEPSAEVLVRVLRLVRAYGLPTAPPGGSDATPEQARRVRLGAIYDLLDRPESSVRIAAMQALEAVSGAGLHSMREEDWQAWWMGQPEKHGP